MGVCFLGVFFSPSGFVLHKKVKIKKLSSFNPDINFHDARIVKVNMHVYDFLTFWGVQ